MKLWTLLLFLSGVSGVYITTGRCAKPITYEECQSEAESKGLTEVVTGSYQPGCYKNYGGFYFNADLSTTVACSDDEPCVCASAEILITTGQCTIPLTLEACATLAEENSFDYYDVGTSYPFGCQTDGVAFVYNTVTSSTTACSANSQCACTFDAPETSTALGCVLTEPYTHAIGATLTDDREFCESQNTENLCYGICQWNLDVCTVTDGSTANTDACLCGTDQCTTTTGLFCYASHNFCHTNSRQVVTCATCQTCPATAEQLRLAFQELGECGTSIVVP